MHPNMSTPWAADQRHSKQLANGAVAATFGVLRRGSALNAPDDDTLNVVSSNCSSKLSTVFPLATRPEWRRARAKCWGVSEDN